MIHRDNSTILMMSTPGLVVQLCKVDPLPSRRKEAGQKTWGQQPFSLGQCPIFQILIDRQQIWSDFFTFFSAGDIALVTGGCLKGKIFTFIKIPLDFCGLTQYCCGTHIKYGRFEVFLHRFCVRLSVDLTIGRLWWGLMKL